jgi:hypothetical protein
VEWNGKTPPPPLGNIDSVLTEIGQVRQSAEKLSRSIPPAGAVRTSLCVALRRVQLLRALLRLAERKERFASRLAPPEGGVL